jgi:hypothetical protein
MKKKTTTSFQVLPNLLLEVSLSEAASRQESQLLHHCFFCLSLSLSLSLSLCVFVFLPPLLILHITKDLYKPNKDCSF